MQRRCAARVRPWACGRLLSACQGCVGDGGVVGTLVGAVSTAGGGSWR